ncbi:MAG: cytochrome c-type biogenesis protein CcmH [Gaiellaceae bacterium MAG52_C11]|nr:cytochrome c-type biogenesis protein CcmH [Candidatus Gaiellasilicea maunaloa]
MKLLGVLVVALVLASPGFASEQNPTAAELESELVCPICDSTLDTSNAEIARRMKAFIRVRIAAGDTKSAIKAKLVEQFGQGVLAVPPRQGFDWLAWLLPLAGVGVAVVVVGSLAWGWSHSRSEANELRDAPPLDPGTERRLDYELDRFE